MSTDELLSRVDALTAAIARRRRDDLACRRGCTACCHVQLSLSPLEAERVQGALRAGDPGLRERVRARAQALAAQEQVPAQAPCVMLEEDGHCAVYAARPLVCRTQGHALRYPKGTLPPEMVFATAGAGEITWCPLNYVDTPPRNEDVLEAERIDLLGGRACLDAGRDPLTRVSMIDLAGE